MEPSGQGALFFSEAVKLGGWKLSLHGSNVGHLEERNLAENEANTRNQNPGKENYKT